MPNFESERWRSLLLLNIIPSVLFLVVAVFIIPESPRYLRMSGRVDEEKMLLKQIARENGPALGLSVLRLNDVIDSSEIKGMEISESRGDLAGLLSCKRGEFGFLGTLFCKSMNLWLLWFCQAFIFYGLVFIAPTTFAVEQARKAPLLVMMTALIVSCMMLQ